MLATYALEIHRNMGRSVKMPAYPVGRPHWPLASPFLLSRDAPEPPDVRATLARGESDLYEDFDDVLRRERSDFLWEVGDYPGCYRLSLKLNNMYKDKDMCELEVQEGECAPGWDPGDAGGWICAAFKACVREGVNDQIAVDEFREKVLEMGARAVTEWEDESVLWALPDDWDDWDAAKRYYREIAIERWASKLVNDPNCVFAFNVLFLVIGSVGWVVLAIGALAVSAE